MGVLAPNFAFFGQQFSDKKFFQQFFDSPKFRGDCPPLLPVPQRHWFQFCYAAVISRNTGLARSFIRPSLRLSHTNP